MTSSEFARQEHEPFTDERIDWHGPPAPRPIPEATVEERARANPHLFPRRLIDSEEAAIVSGYYEGEFSRAKAKTTCPSCGRTAAPLLSPKTRVLEGGWRWVGIDHQQWETDYLCFCRCGAEYRLTIYTPQ